MLWNGRRGQLGGDLMSEEGGTIIPRNMIPEGRTSDTTQLKILVV